MKKALITALLIITIVTPFYFISFFIRSNKSTSNKNFDQKLAGTWFYEIANMRCTNFVAVDGSFISQLIFIHPGHTNTYQMAGTWHLQDDNLIETIISDSNKAAPVPRTHSGQVSSVKPDEFAVSWQGSTNKTVWRKVNP
jgi:hypothetical protein